MSDDTSESAGRCPECGALAREGLSCEEMFGWVLSWEAHDPELLAEHFLTVASYNLQHPAQFTDEALEGLRAAYLDHLDQGLPVAQIRRQMRGAVDGPTRVLKRPAERQPVLRAWPLTIADVYLPDQPEGAAQRVRAWAAAIRRELRG